MDPGTCSAVEAIKLGCENTPPDGRGDKVRNLDARGSLTPLLLRHNGPASGERQPRFIATKSGSRANQLATPGPQEGELEATHALVASPALRCYTNEAA